MTCRFHGVHPCPTCAGFDERMSIIKTQTSNVLNNRSERCGTEDKIECALIAIIEICEELLKVQTRQEGR